jgi:hypothetical protein
MGKVKRGRVIARTRADRNHQVTTIEGGSGLYRKTPCKECPWKRSSPIGAFPAEAYRISAKTAYDMAGSSFACHMAGVEAPTTCAGFLLRGADHNMDVRFALMRGRIDLRKVSDGGHELYDSYREMAIANGVKPSDPALRSCRDD